MQFFYVGNSFSDVKWIYLQSAVYSQCSHMAHCSDCCFSVLHMCVRKQAILLSQNNSCRYHKRSKSFKISYLIKSNICNMTVRDILILLISLSAQKSIYQISNVKFYFIVKKADVSIHLDP